ncbi:MAG TPA: Ku protein [Clostridiales bacterium]|nr:MAG: Ku protein [Clostridiales bacterium GWD2_32_59]HAN09350.1 Ku protein [Clostridiales bacterium]
MAARTKTAISFGLVHIPISLHIATTDNDIHFNQLCKEDNSRVRYKKTCGNCGEEIKEDDIVKGFEYDKDKYVIIDEDDIEKIKTEKDKTIEILHFTNIDQISPIFYEKTYHAVPELNGDKAFELLRRAMMDEQKIAIAQTVLGTKETLLALIPREDGLLIQTMFYNDEIKEIPKTYSKQDISEPELNMAKTLITSMVKPFEPEQYKDRYQEKLKDMISKKIAGQEIVVRKDEKFNNVINLMDALKLSIEKNKPSTKTSSSTKTKTTKRTAVVG